MMSQVLHTLASVGRSMWSAGTMVANGFKDGALQRNYDAQVWERWEAALLQDVACCRESAVLLLAWDVTSVDAVTHM